MVYVIFFLASFVQALGGFGAGLFAVPLLALAYEPKFVVPPFSLTVLVFNILLVSGIRRNIEWDKIFLIVIGSMMGMPFGVFSLKYVNQDIIRLFISAVTVVVGIFFLSGYRPKIREKKIIFILSGIISGFLSGTAAMGGPPLIFLMISMGLSKDVFRACLLTCFLFNGIYANTLYFLNGMFNSENIKIALFGFLPALTGALLGIKAKNLLSDERFDRITIIIVILIGFIGTIRAVFLFL